MVEIATVNPKVIQELFSTYRAQQEEKTVKISKRQEDIKNKIEVADALAVKLLQRFNSSASTMKSTTQHLREVHPLQVEIGELKGRLTEVISNVDVLCQRISFACRFFLLAVHPLQVEIGKLKGKLTEVISSVDALCKRISAYGAEPLRSSIEPFSTELEDNSNLSSLQRLNINSGSAETKQGS